MVDRNVEKLKGSRGDDVARDARVAGGLLGRGTRREKGKGSKEVYATLKGGARAWRAELDRLERMWWGDGYPLLLSKKERRALAGMKECWLDKVD